MLVGLIYDPGFVEADVILSSAILERFGKLKFPPSTSPRLTPAQFAPVEQALSALVGLDGPTRSFVNEIKNAAPRPRFKEYAERVVGLMPDTARNQAKINLNTSRDRLFHSRNDIAHEGASNDQSGSRYVTEVDLRAVRDANRVILSLALLAELRVPEAALNRAAERLGIRYAGRHPSSGVFL